MTEAEFWNLIEAARAESDDAQETAEQLGEQLSELEPETLYAFEEQLARLLERSYTWELWGVAYVLNGGCSDDGFHYFRGWLIAQGREVFERALTDPDSLVDQVEDMEEAECEDILHVATSAYREATGDYPEGITVNLPDLGPSWDFDDRAEMARRYPRSVAQFWPED